MIAITYANPINDPYIPTCEIRLLVDKNAIPTYILQILAAVNISVELLFDLSLSDRCLDESTESEKADHFSDGLDGD